MFNDMNTRLRFNRFLLLGCLLIFTANSATPQEISHDGQGDSLKVRASVQGNLFPTSTITNTGAVSSVGGDVLYTTPTANVTNTLSGRLPGLFSIQENRLPNSERANLSIRGIGSYSNAGYKIYVDGFEVTSDYLDYLSPAEIGSFSILKDAAALSTFGMKGANGVLWIETKKGEIGEPAINVQIRSGIQNAINIHKPLNATDFENLYNQAASNDAGMVWTPRYTGDQIDLVNTDWYEETLRNKGSYTDADLSFHGGTKAVRYFAALGYANQEGLLNVGNTDQTSNDRFSKFNVRTNLDVSMFKILTASVNLSARLQDWNRPNFDMWSLMNNLATYPSNIYPVYDELVTDDPTNYSGTALYPNNPVASIKGLGRQNNRLRILQGNFKFKEDFSFLLKGLYLEQAFSFYVQSQTSFSKTKNYARYFGGVAQTTDQTTSIVANSLGAQGMDQWLQGDFSIGYKNSFGKSSITSALNLNISDYKSNGLFGYIYRYVNFNGRVNYSYDERYVAEVGFSQFGSDAYAPGHRFGLYPALSGAWIASNESFLEDSGVVDLLKVRASVGKTGNSESYTTGNVSSFLSNGRYLYKQYYGGSLAGSFYTGNGAPFSGQGTLAPLFLANRDVFAEQSIKYNLGVDVTLWKKLDLTVDVFMDKRSGILAQDNSQMGYYGMNFQFANIGKMTNRGFEATISFADQVGEVSYSVFGMAFFAKNRIDYMAEIPTGEAYSTLTGRAYGTRMGLESVGFFGVDDFNVDGSLKDGIAQPMFEEVVLPGDLRYNDKNGDGFVDQMDVTEIGPPSYPSWTFSLGGSVAWKGLDFSIFFNGATGGSMDLLDYAQTTAFVDNGNAYPWHKNAWAYYPGQNIDNRSDATYPRLTAKSNQNNYRASSFWIRSNDYLRLRNVELGYDFFYNHKPTSAISKLRLYVNAMNPLTISKVLKEFDLDPESGYGYPALKSYNVGIQMTF
jgi:TonB-linked SusC/RagA family outer membrane protein